MAELNAAINRSTLLKMYNQSDIEQLSRCSARIRHSDDCVKCRFFVVLDDGPALLGLQDKELFSFIRVMCETIGNKTNGRKLDVKLGIQQTIRIAVQTVAQRPGQMQMMQVETKGIAGQMGPQTKLDADNRSGDKTQIPNYVNSGTNKLKCLLIFIPVTAKKLIKELVKQS